MGKALAVKEAGEAVPSLAKVVGEHLRGRLTAEQLDEMKVIDEARLLRLLVEIEGWEKRAGEGVESGESLIEAALVTLGGGEGGEERREGVLAAVKARRVKVLDGQVEWERHGKHSED